VSPSWLNRLEIALGPQEVVATVRRAFARSKPVIHRWSVADGADPLWSGATVALVAGRNTLPPTRRVHVTVANRFVRYTALRIPRTLDDAERSTYLAHKLRTQFGDAAQHWSVRTSDTGHPEHHVVAAMPGALIDALLAALGPHAAIAPALAPAFNAVRRSLRRVSAWAVMLEPGHAVVGWQNEGRWKTLASRALPEPTTAALFRLLDREALLQSIDDTGKDVYLLPGSVRLKATDDARYRLHDLASTAPRHPVHRGLDALAA